MTEHEQNELRNLREAIGGYHADVKRRLDLAENTIREHHVAIHGIAGDVNVPGLNLEVQSLLGFRERVRLGVGAAWAALVTIGCTLWARK
jgi:hypothetical protein